MLRVFVVDDECLVIEGIRLLMEEVNIECEIVGSAYDGISAWNAIQEKHPDVLITDIKIPGIDGLDLISKCKKHFPQLLAIVISGYQEFTLTSISEQVADMVSQLSKVEGVFLFDDYNRYIMYLGNGEKTAPYLTYYTTGPDKDADWYQAVEQSKGKEIFWNEDVLNPENRRCFSVVKILNDTSKYKPHGILVVTVSTSL